MKKHSGLLNTLVITSIFALSILRAAHPIIANAAPPIPKDEINNQIPRFNSQAIALSSTWAKTYGGSFSDVARTAVSTDDGGYLVGGFSQSFGSDQDGWMIKLDTSGNVVWQKTYGTSNTAEDIYSIARAQDGGYVAVGESHTSTRLDDAWIFKVDASGNLVWQKSIGGSDIDVATSIAATPDGGFIISVEAASFGDFWVLRLNASGDLVWQKRYGDSTLQTATAIVATLDGGSVVVGNSASDAWAIKLDSSGEVVWQKKYGTSNFDTFYAVAVANDGGFIAAGITGPWSGTDAWVVKLDSLGNIAWQKTYGGSGTDQGLSIAPTADGGYVLGGLSIAGAGQGDAWLVKLDNLAVCRRDPQSLSFDVKFAHE